MRYIREILIFTSVIMVLLAVEFVYIPWGSLDNFSAKLTNSPMGGTHTGGTTYVPNLPMYSSNIGFTAVGTSSSHTGYKSVLGIFSSAGNNDGSFSMNTSNTNTSSSALSYSTTGNLNSISGSGTSNSNLSFSSGMIAQNMSNSSQPSSILSGSQIASSSDGANGNNASRPFKSAMVDPPPPDPSPIGDAIFPMLAILLCYALYKYRVESSKRALQ